jgi:hypothetical protein
MTDIEPTYTPQSTKKDRGIAKKFSPNLNSEECISLNIDNKTTVYIPHWKIKKYGLDYYKKKYSK